MRVCQDNEENGDQENEVDEEEEDVGEEEDEEDDGEGNAFAPSKVTLGLARRILTSTSQCFR